MVTFLVGQSRMAIESLAVLPVVHALVFIFMSFGFSFHEAAVALIGDKNVNYRPLRDFAIGLGLITTAVLVIIGFTPVSVLWFHHLSGLSLELTELAKLPIKIAAPAPAVAAFIFFQRAILINARRTKPITWATVVEVTTILATLLIGIHWVDAIGANAASASLMLGSIGACAYLFRPFRRALAETS